jgi:hypothetical protein
VTAGNTRRASLIVIATLAVLSIAALPVVAYVQRGGYGGGGGWVVTLAGVVAEQVTSVRNRDPCTTSITR